MNSPPMIQIEELQKKVDSAEILWRKGDLYGAAGSYGTILAERLSETRESGEFTAADIFIFERFADLSSLLGNVDAAAALLEASAGLCDGAGNRVSADFSRLKLAHLYLGAGDARHAAECVDAVHTLDFENLKEGESLRSFLSRSEERFPWKNYRSGAEERELLASTFYLLSGQMYAANGQYENARTFYDAGIRHAGPESEGIRSRIRLNLLISKSISLVESGLLKDADELLRKIDGITGSVYDIGPRVIKLETDGKIALLRGEFGKTLRILREIFTLCDKHKLDTAAERALLNLSGVMILLNQTVEAEDILEHIAARNNDRPDKEILLRCNILLRLAAARTQSSAPEAYLSVTGQWRGDGNVFLSEPSPPIPRDIRSLAPDISYLSLFEDRLLSFYFFINSADFEGAARELARLEEMFGESDSELVSVRLSVCRAMISYYAGEIARAEVLFTDVCARLGDMGLLPEQWQCRRFLQWSRARLGQGEAEQRIAVLETEQILDRLAKSLSSEDRVLFLLNKWTADEEILGSRLSEIVDIKRQSAAANWVRRIALNHKMRRKLSGLLDHINKYKSILAHRSVSGETDKDSDVPKISIWTRLLRHSPFRATISFLVLPNRVLVVRQGWMIMDFGISALTRLKLRNDVKDWHKNLSRFSNGLRDLEVVSDPTDEEFAGESDGAIQWNESRPVDVLSEQLAGNLRLDSLFESLPFWTKGITFVPDDCLHGFPFSALRFEQKYVIEKFAVTVDFDRKAGRIQPEQTGRSKALTVGINSGSDTLDPLVGVVEEINKVGRWLNENHIAEVRLNDFEETAQIPGKDLIARSLPKVDLAHFACHGVFKPDDAEQTGLVLNAQSMEILNLREISELDLSGLKHITLSSCWAADQLVLPGRWVIGLPEIICRAGAESLLGSLWPVDDASAVNLIDDFYHKLGRRGRDQALRRSQLEFLKPGNTENGNPQYAHPFYWAGFTLYGSPRKLELSPGPWRRTINFLKLKIRGQKQKLSINSDSD